MRHAPLLRLSFALSLPLTLAACDDGFERTDFGSLSVETVGGTSEPVSDGEDISFRLVRPGDNADNQAFKLQNANEAGVLTVRSITLTTESPWLTATLQNESPTCDAGVCVFDEFDLRPLEAVQLDLSWLPQTTDNQCGTPPEGAPGNWCGSVEFVTNDPSAERLTINLLVAEAGGEMQVCTEDGTCGENIGVMFTDAIPGDPQQVRRFTIDNIGENDLLVSKLEATWLPNTIEADFTIEATPVGPPWTLSPGDPPVSVALTFAPTTMETMRAGTIRIESDGASSPNANISVSVGESNLPSIEVDKTSLSFVNIQNPATDTQEITLTNAGGATAAPLTVNFRLDPSDNADYTAFNEDGDVVAGVRCGMASPPPTCSNPLVIERQSSHVISVTYAPTTQDATNAALVINSNDAENSLIEVALNASGGQGFLVSDATQLTWTMPAVGMSAETFTVTNDGNAAVTISAIDVANATPAGAEAQFAIESSALPIELAPMATETVTVTYTQPDETPTLSRAADVVLTHDGAGGQTIVSLAVQN